MFSRTKYNDSIFLFLVPIKEIPNLSSLLQGDLQYRLFRPYYGTDITTGKTPVCICSPKLSSVGQG